MLDAHSICFVMHILITAKGLNPSYLKIPLQQGSLSIPA